MKFDDVPAALGEVVGPLQEADAYARLQEIRQLGLYTLLIGLPAFFLPGTNPLSLAGAYLRGPSEGIDGVRIASLAIQWVLFILACYTPRLLMPLVRRRRPDWESPMLASSLLKKDLEAHFWFQLPVLLGYVFAIALGMLISALAGVTFTTAALGLVAVVHVVGMLLLARDAARRGDRELRTVYLGLLPLAFLALAFMAGGVPEMAWMPLVAGMGLCVTVPTVALGLFRLLAPRRWLLR